MPQSGCQSIRRVLQPILDPPQCLISSISRKYRCTCSRVSKVSICILRLICNINGKDSRTSKVSRCSNNPNTLNLHLILVKHLCNISSRCCNSPEGLLHQASLGKYQLRLRALLSNLLDL